MNNFAKNVVFVLFFLFTATIVFSLIVEISTTKPEEISLNELAQLVSDGEVEKILIKGDSLEITLADNEAAVSQKEPDTSLTQTLLNLGVNAEDIRMVELVAEGPGGFRYWAGIILPALIPILIIIFIFLWIFRQARTGVNQAFTFGKANARLFSSRNGKVKFKDVAGLKEAKEDLEEVVDFLKSPKKFLDIGARIPRGVLLMGPPGTGKTLLARSVAGEANVPFFHISASEFVEMFVGVGASRVRDLFQTAKKAAPSIIFVDEIDAVGRERGAGMGGGHDEREQTLNQILVEMDGFDRDTNIIVMAATNRADILDSALLRPGRFDRRVILDMPDIADREEILKIHVKGKSLDDSVDLKTIAIRTPGFSGADLANLINEAAILAARKNRKAITQEDLMSSIEEVMLGPARRSRIISQKEKEITAFHEAGHALIAAALKDADPVQKVSIVSRGIAGGYTLKLPIEERRLKTRDQFLADLAVAFGGYAAEKAVFKDISTGSSNDIRQATDIAHRLVTQFGMSEKLGPRTFGKREDMIFLGREISTEKDYSESIGTIIDEEINDFIEKALSTAKRIISKNKKALEEIARVLMERETIEKKEFEELIKKFGVKEGKVR